MKKHKFTLTVKTDMSRREAWLKVLFAFASREPDGCEFNLKLKPEKKQKP